MDKKGDPVRTIARFFFSRKTGNMLAILVVAIFFILSLARHYTETGVKEVIDMGKDDWFQYARNAADIKANGVLLRSEPGPYFGPSGFLYNYFLAFFLTVFGDRLLSIYIAHHIMLGLSVALLYWTFRDKMRDSTGLMFLMLLFLFALLDVYKYYSTKLLSENLALFIMALFFFCFVKGFENGSRFLQLASSALLGFFILTRPNIAVFAAALVPLVWFYYYRKSDNGFFWLLLFVTVLVLSSSFLAVRNYMVCKSWAFLPKIVMGLDYHTSFSGFGQYSVDPASIDTNALYAKLRLGRHTAEYIEYLLQHPFAFFGYYMKKALFLFGFLPVLEPAYHIRPHWTVMWIGYFSYIYLRLKAGGRLMLWEAAANLYILCYCLSLVTANVGNYGFRIVVPMTGIILVFSSLAFDGIRRHKPAKN